MKTFNVWMDSLTDWMNENVSPAANRISRNAWVKSAQEAILAVVPMILVGSLITLVSILNNYFPWMPDLNPINQFTFGLMGLLVAFVLPYQLMQNKGLSDRRLVAGMTGVAVFLLLIGRTFSEDGATIMFSFERFGAVGMFTAIIGGLIVGAVFILFARLRLFKDSSALPDFLIVWFDSLLPILVCVLTGWALVDVASFDVYGAIQFLFSPLVAIGQSFWGFVLFMFLMGFMYSFGISPWILYSLLYPVLLQGIQDNATAVAAGQPAGYINTVETITAWLTAGGMGITLPLVLMMTFGARSARLKAIGRATVVPSLFNINEPVVFGAPIALNPTLMIPFWINQLVPPMIVYGALSTGLVAIPSQVFQMWYLPIPFSTWIISPGFGGLLLLAIIVTFATLVWLPFFRAYDRQAVAEDEANDSEPLPSAEATA